MSLLEFAEKTSPLPLMPWQKEFIAKFEEAQKENKVLTCIMGKNNGRTMFRNMVNEFYGKTVIL